MKYVLLILTGGLMLTLWIILIYSLIQQLKDEKEYNKMIKNWEAQDKWLEQFPVRVTSKDSDFLNLVCEINKPM